MKLNKQAYTLTELLVVVLLIGILAALVLPKFSNVIDSIRLTEAENLMRVVRNEQEQRCTLDKRYTPYFSQLTVLPGSSGISSGDNYFTSNFEYALVLNSASSPIVAGITATDLKNGVVLEMPSFLDGRICCDNCAGLNKEYMECADLMARGDFDAATSDCLPL